MAEVMAVPAVADEPRWVEFLQARFDEADDNGEWEKESEDESWDEEEDDWDEDEEEWDEDEEDEDWEEEEWEEDEWSEDEE
jgi:segregation and condensation protein B